MNVPRRLKLVVMKDCISVFPHFVRKFPELQDSLVTPNIALVIVLLQSWVRQIAILQYWLRYHSIVRCQPICFCSANALSTNPLTKSGILLTSSIGVSRVSSQDLIQEV
jgi:hypothetical protein